MSDLKNKTKLDILMFVGIFMPQILTKKETMRFFSINEIKI
jgi:hypothetical protein